MHEFHVRSPLPAPRCLIMYMQMLQYLNVSKAGNSSGPKHFRSGSVGLKCVLFRSESETTEGPRLHVLSGYSTLDGVRGSPAGPCGVQSWTGRRAAPHGPRSLGRDKHSQAWLGFLED